VAGPSLLNRALLALGHLSSYNKTAADLTDEKMMVDFIEKRLKEIDGFKFFDYGNRYEIDLPKWPVTEQTP
jgi:hypothetical protein